jgi:cysteinyl-tRNA synthetase
MKLYNTREGKKEDLVPLSEGLVGMYVCGVTVYDYCHLGHARGAVVFDVVRRYLEYSGFKVTFVKNFTDIDDKIIARAAEENVDPAALAERFVEEYRRDMRDLGVRPADIEPKATEHIGDIISLTAALVENGSAYEVDGDVYFRVKNFDGYGKLSGRSTEDMMAGARVEIDERKEDPLDFALWKASKEGEPWWESPWGKGRPGWHIECSAMSAFHLGEQFDIHGGGKDLVFPHHENEIAQSEAFTGKPFVRYWMHNGFVNVNREKMSKSLGNFFTIREILQKYEAEAVRLFLLSTHYRSPIDFSDQNLEEATRTLDRFYHLLEELRGKAAGAAGTGSPESAAAVSSLAERFERAMDDDFNTAEALGEIFKTTRSLSGALARGALPGQESLGTFFSTVGKIGNVLGVLNSTPESWRDRREQRAEEEKSAVDGSWVESKIAEREAARAARDWAAADAIREELLSKGVTLEDTPGGTVWRLKSP